MQLVDTHCHIHFANYPLTLKKVLADARAAGVTKLICAGTTLADSQKAASLAIGQPGVWAAAGVHPHDAKSFINNQSSAEILGKLVRQPKIVATGEIGLDYYRSYSPPDVQKKALIAQIEVGLGTELPFIFHVREAWDDFWQIFDSYPGLRGVVHSFSAHPEQLQQILKRELYVGLNGIMTFTTDPKQLEAARKVPQDRLLLETDAPFLTPKPFRGEVCEPKHVRNVAQFLAELRQESLEELAAASTKNAAELFNLNDD